MNQRSESVLGYSPDLIEAVGSNITIVRLIRGRVKRTPRRPSRKGRLAITVPPASGWASAPCFVDCVCFAPLCRGLAAFEKQGTHVTHVPRWPSYVSGVSLGDDDRVPHKASYTLK